MTNSVRELIVPLHVKAAAVVTLALGLTYAGSAHQVGPWWFWASDACPDSGAVCGMMPLGPVAASGIAALTIGVLSR